jgi:hypothetical protein
MSQYDVFGFSDLDNGEPVSTPVLGQTSWADARLIGLIPELSGRYICINLFVIGPIEKMQRIATSSQRFCLRNYAIKSLTPNADFYSNKIPCQPDGVFLDYIHNHWFGDYQKLELYHGYIQWLFPISEGGGVNPLASPLSLEEKKVFQQVEYQNRVLKSLDLMLDFYGLQRSNTKYVKKADYLLHFDSIEQHPHNLLRITRILKCLKEIGLVEHKNTLFSFLENEVVETRDLDFCRDSYERFWRKV